MGTSKRKSNGWTGNPRQGYDFYGLNERRVEELKALCGVGAYPLETLQEACAGFEWIMPWILLSVQKKGPMTVWSLMPHWEGFLVEEAIFTGLGGGSFII